MRIDPVVEKVLAELKFNPKDCLWEKHSAVCMKHRYIEIAGQHKGVIINECHHAPYYIIKNTVNTPNRNWNRSNNRIFLYIYIWIRKKESQTNKKHGVYWRWQ